MYSSAGALITPDRCMADYILLTLRTNYFRITYG